MLMKKGISASGDRGMSSGRSELSLLLFSGSAIPKTILENILFNAAASSALVSTAIVTDCRSVGTPAIAQSRKCGYGPAAFWNTVRTGLPPEAIAVHPFFPPQSHAPSAPGVLLSKVYCLRSRYRRTDTSRLRSGLPEP